MIAASDLLAIGFVAENGENGGALRAPAGSRVELNPVGAQFYELKITVGGGNPVVGNPVVTVIVHESAIKIAKSCASSPALIDDK